MYKKLQNIFKRNTNEFNYKIKKIKLLKNYIKIFIYKTEKKIP